MLSKLFKIGVDLASFAQDFCKENRFACHAISFGCLRIRIWPSPGSGRGNRPWGIKTWNFLNINFWNFLPSDLDVSRCETFFHKKIKFQKPVVKKLDFCLKVDPLVFFYSDFFYKRCYGKERIKSICPMSVPAICFPICYFKLSLSNNHVRESDDFGKENHVFW